MRPPHRRRHSGWLSPVYNFMDSMGNLWWNTKRFFSRVFDFRWLTASLGGLVRYIWWAVRYPFYVMGWLLQQMWSVLVAWWQIRNFRYLIQGLPALIAIIFIIIVTAYTILRSDDGLQEQYIRQANDSLMRADKQKAQLCLERLMQLQYAGDPRKLETQFKLGKLAFELQQYQRSRSLLSELANPDNDDGYVDAHLEKARMLYYQGRKQKNEMETIEKHLRRALKKQPEHKEVNGFLGLIMFEQGRTDEAIPFLQKSDPMNVDARLALAKIHKLRGNQAQANLYLEPLIDYLKNNASGEIDDIRYRALLANAHVQMDEFEEAVKVLENAYSMKKSEIFKVYLSNCYLSWFYKLSRMPVTPDRERQKLDCLVRALEWDNTNVSALSMFVLYMNNTGNDAGLRDRAHKLLMANRGNNAYLHMWLGQKLLSESKFEEAYKEWDMAFNLNPDSAVIANNFAWILTQGSKQPIELAPDLLKAEQIINEVLKRVTPDDANRPYYLGTRGTIYMKMGRFDEALKDLVGATQRRDAANDITLQKQLVEVYERLRMPTMAESHRKLMNEALKRNVRTEGATQ